MANFEIGSKEVPPLSKPAEFVAWVRAFRGPESVSIRKKAEDDAIALLEEKAGGMTSEEAKRLQLYFNTDSRNGVRRNDRFAPAFQGWNQDRLLKDIDLFNRQVEKLWQSDEDAALAVLDDLLRNPNSFPGAGQSLTCLIFYLRDRTRYVPWMNGTHKGLRAVTGFEGLNRQGGIGAYRAYCDKAIAFGERWGLAAQEIDGVLALAGRAHQNPPIDPPVQPQAAVDGSYSLAQLAKDVYLPQTVLEQWENMLRNPNKRQAIFFGPPGTGKTYVAQRFGKYLSQPSGEIFTVQFHPSYSYEHFLEGLHPVVRSDGTFSYEIRPGSFLSFCERARVNQDSTFVFVIDEINRADLASVLGELMMLLEYRETKLTLPYSQRQFSVPKNVVVLGTMNTADRSIALLDFALRRRFHAIGMDPEEDILKGYLQEKGTEGAQINLALDLFGEVKKAFSGSPDYAPGHSYWMLRDLTADGLMQMWKYELRPYVSEWLQNPLRMKALDDEVGKILGELT